MCYTEWVPVRDLEVLLIYWGYWLNYSMERWVLPGMRRKYTRHYRLSYPSFIELKCFLHPSFLCGQIVRPLDSWEVVNVLLHGDITSDTADWHNVDTKTFIGLNLLYLYQEFRQVGSGNIIHTGDEGFRLELLHIVSEMQCKDTTVKQNNNQESRGR